MELEDSSGFGWDADLNCVVAEDWVWDRYIEVSTIQAWEAGVLRKFIAWDPIIGLSRRLGDMLRYPL